MTLPKRFVALLLVYCFVIAVAPYSRPAVSANIAPAAESKIEAPGSLAPTPKNSDPRQSSWLPSWLSSWFSSADEEDETEESRGLRFRLSEAPNQPETRAVNKVAPATPLSAAQTQAILLRLPQLKIEPGDEADFARRGKSLPPPRTGETITQPFPAANDISAPESTTPGPLDVVRFSPEGEVPLAPNLSVTFSQPMVAITSQEEAARVVPVKLSPQPRGKWRWVGTKTLLFEPDGRFAMATEYSVTVPEGTRSANGGTLAQSKTWKFSTPPPTVKTTYPGSSTTRPRDQLMFVEFDQRIDPATVLRTIKVRAGNSEIRTRLATKEETEADEELRDRVKQAEKDRWLAFRAVDAQGATKFALPGGAAITVSVEAGTSSAEGPRKTVKAQEFSFSTFGPLQLVRSRCILHYDKGPCLPDSLWQIEFSNPLNEEVFQESQVRIEPSAEGLKVSVAGNVVRIHGTKKPNTNYRVTIDKSLRDRFDQTLGKDEVIEFKVGPAAAWLALSGQGFVVLDPAGPRQLSLYSVNYQTVKVKLFAVEPADWGPFQIYRATRFQHSADEVGKKATLPGRLIMEKQIELNSPNEMIETVIDLTPALKDGLGQVIVSIESIMPVSDRYRSPQFAWVQSTNMGLDAFADNDELIGWASSLADGAPLGDVKLEILPSGVSGITASDGVAHLPLKPASESSLNLLVARRGNDVAILPEKVDPWVTSGRWHHGFLGDELRWYVFDDRKLYRPGEEVHLKGWIRSVGAGKSGDIGSLGGSVKRVSYAVTDYAGNEVAKGQLSPNVFGGFDTTFKLPANMNLGGAQVKFETHSDKLNFDEEEHTHYFQVQEFRRPEFEVTAKTESEAPLFVGGSADVSVTANYFAGGGLPNAPVEWEVTSRPTNFTPPNRSDFTFGKWIPWWTDSSDDDEQNSEEFTGRTDATGKHRLRIDFDSVKPARPSSVNAHASISDVNRQTWASTATLLVHPADLYVGLKSDRTFVQKGEPMVVQSIVTDLDGKASANRQVKMRAVLLDWKQIKGDWTQVEVNPQDCSIQSGAEAVKCTFQSKEGGTYRVTATIRDDRGRANESELTLWVAGGKRPPHRGVEAEKVEMIPDRKDYRAGDTAEILIQAPFFPAEGVMTLRRSGILKSERFRMDGPSFTLRVPVEEAWTPNVHLQVDLVGAAEREANSAGKDAGGPQAGMPALRLRPAFASGEINLSIPPSSRRLAVTVTSRDKTLEPGAQTTVDVEVKDSAGKSISGSEVAVVVVDEAVLALTNYKLADPVATFYTERDENTSDHHLRQNILLAREADTPFARLQLLAEMNKASGLIQAANASYAEISELPINGRNFSNFVLDGVNVVTKSGTNDSRQIRMRENFNALAVFSPSVRTDASGRAQVRVKLPDNLTRYRVMAVAVAGDKQFGSGESAITARLPLMARPSAPRFLNFGDRFELPIVVQNQSNAPMTVDVAVRATNADVGQAFLPVTAGPGSAAKQGQTGMSVLHSEAGRRVTVPANDRVEVRIPAAAVKAGTARFQIAAVSGRWSDAAEVSLPVWTPATTEAFATYGHIDEGAITQPVKVPANVFPQFGGLEIETSSTQLQELTDAVLYLANYRYECSEQLSSRIIAIAALRDVLTAFKAKDLPSPDQLKATVARDLKNLQGLQNVDGGFGFWKRGDESWPYVSIHVAHALARAREKKFDVPNETFERSLKYLREIESHIPAYYGPEARRAVIAYALYVRHRMGNRDAIRARKLIAEAGGLDNLSLESVGWLLSVLSGDPGSRTEVEAIRRHLNNRATETAATAHFASSYKDSDYLLLNSDRRTDGIILEALIADQPANDLIPKIVRGLLAHRTRGRWENTQENVFILLALDRYFNTYEKVTPNFVARAWLGEQFAGEQEFKGRSTDRQQVNVPMRYLANQVGPQNLIINKDGSGRLYYRIGMNYAPSDLNLKAADYGFTVERSYEAVDDPKDVSRDADGGWHIKAGARVRVRLTMVAPARRYHVALVDPLPAGFESLNPALAVTESIPEDEQQAGVTQFGSRSSFHGFWRWRLVWFDHQNLRDERAEAFTSLLWEGVYNYSYVARATTPGIFVVPPAKAEEMYHPETFGRGKTDRVRIE